MLMLAYIIVYLITYHIHIISDVQLKILKIPSQLYSARTRRPTFDQTATMFAVSESKLPSRVHIQHITQPKTNKLSSKQQTLHDR